MSGGERAPRIVRFADVRRTPWRNGRGETVEVAVHPAGTGLDAFGWRVSLARIARDGPFSTFRDVDRTFALLDGGSLVLAVGSDPPARLDVGGEAIRFAGEADCRCNLSGSPATALNVMTRRGSFDCTVTRLDPAERLLRAGDSVTLLVCAEAGIGTDLGPLGRLDVLLIPSGAEVGLGPWRPSARASRVSIWGVDRHRPG